MNMPYKAPGKETSIDFISVAERFEQAFDLYRGNLALRWRERESRVFYEMIYNELDLKSKALAMGLISMGVKQQDHVGLIADNSAVWTIANLAIQRAYAVDVPRGTDSTSDELAYIIHHSGSKIVFVHYASEIDKIQKGLRKYKGTVKKYIVMNNSIPRKHKSRAITMRALSEKGYKLLEKNDKKVIELDRRREKVGPEDLVTIVYTSGTTGRPKGVMLTQKNFFFQFEVTPALFQNSEEDRGLNLLPPWHIFGRLVEYSVLVAGASLTYTDVRHLASDLKEIQPSFLPAVPRIWEGIYHKVFAVLKNVGQDHLFHIFKKYAIKYFFAKYDLIGNSRIFKKPSFLQFVWSKIKNILTIVVFYIPQKIGALLLFRKVVDATGGQIRVSVAGGAALPSYIDEFFAAIGIPIFEGYGLTETAGVVSLRRADRRIPGTVGQPIEGVELKLVDEAGQDVTHIADAKGTLHVRGDIVMKGYYKDKDRTDEVIDSEGWFNTGDVVKITTGGDICIVGRSKDTIVLVGGENLEPVPIEDKLKESDFIEHVMVVGQDQKHLGALIVPDEKELGDFARRIGIRSLSMSDWVKEKKILELYKSEINDLINYQNGFKGFERIATFRLITKAFEKGDELNNTMKIRRHVVNARYEKEIDGMFD